MSIQNNSALSKILCAREDRAIQRSKFSKLKKASISLTLNIAGYPKYNSLTKIIFKEILIELKTTLQANRIQSSFENEIILIDEAGHFFISELKDSNLSLIKIKSITENIESTHPLGRLIDIDVFNQNAQPISSGKKKKCIICNTKAAVECMRDNTHTYKEVRAVMFKQIEDYLADKRTRFIIRKLSEISAKSLLYEVSLSPKPGLVDFNTSGAHRDMNYYTFLHSSTAISQYWQYFSEAGLSYQDKLSNALPVIRKIGLKTEEKMFLATGGVNTQKGLIFLLGLSIFTTSYLLKTENQFSADQFIKAVKTICQNIIENELENTEKANITHGETTYKKYGSQGAGVRYEAQNGFPVVFNHALPLLEMEMDKKSFFDKEHTDKALKTCLITIISILNDSNVLYRKGLENLEELKSSALLVLDHTKSYHEFCEDCIKNDISPGGSADMLALTLFFYFVKQELILE